MLDELLSKKEVLCFIKEIKTNDRYFQKNNSSSLNTKIKETKELALYIFYDALFKFKIIIDDNNLFDDYLKQLERLYVKLDDFEDVRFGINKLLCRELITKLDIKDLDDDEIKKIVITEIYDKYITNGYFIHGFNSAYCDSIKKNGFVPEEYENYYDRFIRVNNIFKNYGINDVITKDFDSKRSSFTDDIVMGCNYSSYSPMFFFNFLTNEVFSKRIRKDYYLIDDYVHLISYLKRFMSNNLFNEHDKKYILSLVFDEWELLHRNERKIALLLVKRNKFSKRSVSLNEFLNNNSNLVEVVDRLLSSKYNNIYLEEEIKSSDLEILLLDVYYDKVIQNENEVSLDLELYKKKEEEVKKEFLDKYGSVSILLLLGSIFISLGVIITVITLLRG